jgi:hypothetical protein
LIKIFYSKDPAPQIFGRLWCLPDGSPTVFHESLDWNVTSKLGGYSYENFNYEPHRNEFKVRKFYFLYKRKFQLFLKIFNKKPKWHSESKLADLMKESPRFFQRQMLIPTSSLPSIPDIPHRNESYNYQQPHQDHGTERKVNKECPVNPDPIRILTITFFLFNARIQHN